MRTNSYNPYMKQWLELQYQNAFLWVPFIMAAGAALYFAGTNTACALFAIASVCIGIAGLVRKNKYAVRAAIIFLFGMLYAAIYSNLIATPRIYRPMRDIEIQGRVDKIDYTPDKTRIFLSIPAQQIRSSLDKNAVVRLNVSDRPDIHIGDEIKATASIFPPAASYAPETFDYSRWAYFNKLSATGFISSYQVIAHGNGDTINRLRDYLHSSAQSFLADTLVLGYKSAIPRDEGAIWTAAGIGHVWSISGFHMTLVAGWLFAIFYLIFRLVPYITRRVPARIPAMIFAWMGLLFYLFLSGTDVATIRAFLMTTLVFGAFILGRNALSMRNISIAFCIIFLINPHYVMQPGFQLSFSAIFGLIWFWNGRRSYKITRIGKISYAIYAAAMTSIVATIFTAPFVTAHFYSMPVYGLVGNLLLMPIFSFAIMPAVIIGTITAPLGWHWPLVVADALYTHTLQMARAIAQLPFANIMTPHIPNTAILLIITGFLCIMFLRPATAARNVIVRNINYVLGAGLILTGLIVTVSTPRPLFYASPDHELVAFSYDDKLEFNKARASGHLFAFDTWKQLNREPVGTPNIRRRGDHGVWRYDTPNFNLVYIQKFVPLAREIVSLCRDDNVDYIVSYFGIDSEKCNHKILRGGFVIYPSGRVRHNSQMRPWNSQHQ